jgi:hypothetical protein
MQGLCMMDATQAQSTAERARRPYTRPRLFVYCTLPELTLTQTESNRMNDMFGPLKT